MKKKALFPIVAIGLLFYWFFLRAKKTAPIPYGSPGNAQNGANAAAAGKALQQQQQSQGWLGDLFKAIASLGKGGGGSSGGGGINSGGVPGKAPTDSTKPPRIEFGPKPLEPTFSGWHDPLDDPWNWPGPDSPSPVPKTSGYDWGGGGGGVPDVTDPNYDWSSFLSPVTYNTRTQSWANASALSYDPNQYSFNTPTPASYAYDPSPVSYAGAPGLYSFDSFSYAGSPFDYSQWNQPAPDYSALDFGYNYGGGGGGGVDYSSGSDGSGYDGGTD